MQGGGGGAVPNYTAALDGRLRCAVPEEKPPGRFAG